MRPLELAGRALLVVIFAPIWIPIVIIFTLIFGACYSLSVTVRPLLERWGREPW